MSQGAGADNVIHPPPPGASFYGGLGPAIVGVSWTLCAIATVELSVRIYTSFRVVKNGASWSLMAACVAWALGVPSVVLYTLAALNGLGNHISIAAFSPTLPDAILYEWIAACTISFAVWFGKLSAMLFIFEIQSTTYPAWKWILYILVGVNLICYIITVPFIFTECEPAAKLWNAELPGVCNGSIRAFDWAVFTGAWGTLTDAVLALYPIAMIIRLKISTRLKVTLCALLGLGFFTAICSLIKTVQFGRLNSTTDATYEIAPLMIWGMTEMWLVLIASSMAPIWPTLRIGGQKISSMYSRRILGGSTSGGRRTSARGYSGYLNKNGSAAKEKAMGEDIKMGDGIRLTREISVHSEQASAASRV